MRKNYRIYYTLNNGSCGATRNMTKEETNQWLKDKSSIVSNANKMWLINLTNSTDTRLI